MDITEIINRNYQATVKRGLINILTNFNDFYLKIVEETEELNKSKLSFSPPEQFDSQELADIILVCFAMATHFDIDILTELEKKIIINENRK